MARSCRSKGARAHGSLACDERVVTVAARPPGLSRLSFFSPSSLLRLSFVSPSSLRRLSFFSPSSLLRLSFVVSPSSLPAAPSRQDLAWTVEPAFVLLSTSHVTRIVDNHKKTKSAAKQAA
jgi:hypothetical protein